jgi:hypothetical protein
MACEASGGGGGCDPWVITDQELDPTKEEQTKK